MPILFAPALDQAHVAVCNGRPCIEFIVTDPDGICPPDFKAADGTMLLDEVSVEVRGLIGRLAAGDGSVREPLADIGACMGYLDDQLTGHATRIAAQRVSSTRPTWSVTVGTWRSDSGLLTALGSGGDLSRVRSITRSAEQRQILSSISTMQVELLRLEGVVEGALR